jgi:hypothetical protein
MLVKVLFLVGILLAVLMRFWGFGGIWPWIVGGLGLVTGVVAWKERTPGILVATIA